MRAKPAIIVFTIVLALQFSAYAALKIVSPAPELLLTNKSGKTVSTKKLMDKKVTALVFVSSSSDSCLNELAELEKIKREIRRWDFKIVAVFLDKRFAEMQSAIKKRRFRSDLLIDKNLTSVEKYRILIVPTLYLIDKKGNLRSVFIDYEEKTIQNVKDEVLKLLAEK